MYQLINQINLKLMRFNYLTCTSCADFKDKIIIKDNIYHCVN